MLTILRFLGAVILVSMPISYYYDKSTKNINKKLYVLHEKQNHLERDFHEIITEKIIDLEEKIIDLEEKYIKCSKKWYNCF